MKFPPFNYIIFVGYNYRYLYRIDPCSVRKRFPVFRFIFTLDLSKYSENVFIVPGGSSQKASTMYKVQLIQAVLFVYKETEHV